MLYHFSYISFGIISIGNLLYLLVILIKGSTRGFIAILIIGIHIVKLRFVLVVHAFHLSDFAIIIINIHILFPEYSCIVILFYKEELRVRNLIIREFFRFLFFRFFSASRRILSRMLTCLGIIYINLRSISFVIIGIDELFPEYPFDTQLILYETIDFFRCDMFGKELFLFSNFSFVIILPLDLISRLVFDCNCFFHHMIGGIIAARFSTDECSLSIEAITL